MRKKRKYYIYCLLLITIFFLFNDKIEAKTTTKTCTYNSKLGEVVLSCPVDGNPAYRYCSVSSGNLNGAENNVSEDSIYSTSVYLDTDDSCPEIYLYEKRAGENKYTVFGSSVDVNGMSFALTHEPRNIVEFLRSPDHTYPCSSTEYDNNAKKIEEAYQKHLKNNYDTLISELENTDTTPSNKEDASSCNTFKEKSSVYANRFSVNGSYTENFINETQTIINEIPKTCALTDQQQKDLETLIKQKINWATSVGKLLGNQGNINYKECLEKTNLNEEQKEDLKDKADKESDDQNEKLEQDKEDFNENFDNIIDVATGIELGDSVEETCEGLLGTELLDIIDEIFTWIKIIVPIIVIVLGSLDFAKAVLIQEKNELQKAGVTFVKRCIIAVAIFFIPTILNYILEWVNSSTCGIR